MRQWLGYDRLDNPKAVPLMNELYTTEWRLFQNFFCPSVKLISKERIASRTVKRYDKPQTPYQRILTSSEIDDNKKENLKAIYKTLNPFTLRKSMEDKLKAIFRTL